MPAGDRAVVVGATGALGSAICRRLLDEGLTVVGVGRDAEALAAAAARTGLQTCVADLASDAAVDALATGIPAGPVRLAVHCAAAPLGGPVLDCSTDMLAAAFEIKVGGLLRLVHGLGARLGAGSRLVAIGGNLGFDPTPGASTAGVANAAQANLVRQLSAALGPLGITVHTVAPGPVVTERFQRLTEGEARGRGVPAHAVRDEATAASPLGRLTTPEEVAWAVARLADPEAAALTGSTLLLDAGRRTAIP